MLNWKTETYDAISQERKYFTASVAGLDCCVGDDGPPDGWTWDISGIVAPRKARGEKSGKKACENYLRWMAKEITGSLPPGPEDPR